MGHMPIVQRCQNEYSLTSYVISYPPPPSKPMHKTIISNYHIITTQTCLASKLKQKASSLLILKCIKEKVIFEYILWKRISRTNRSHGLVHACNCWHWFLNVLPIYDMYFWLKFHSCKSVTCCN